MYSYLHNKKRQKELRKKYLLDKKEKKKKIKYIDKLFIRIFFSSLLLLIVTYFTSFDNKFKNKITNAFDENINFLQLTNKVDSLFLNKLFNKGDITVYSKTFYEQVEYKNGVNYVSNSSTSAVESLVDGVVIKIEKANNLYSVYIQSIDDVIYEFRNLESIDVFIYSYVNQKDVIGKAIYDDVYYRFELLINKDNEYLNYYDNSED
jgi:hypothetical protein